MLKKAPESSRFGSFYHVMVLELENDEEMRLMIDQES